MALSTVARVAELAALPEETRQRRPLPILVDQLSVVAHVPVAKLILVGHATKLLSSGGIWRIL